MRTLDTLINGRSLNAEGLYTVRRPDIPTPQKLYKRAKIMHRDGQLSKDTGFFDDIEFQIEFNFMSDPNLVNDAMRKYRKIFFSAERLLLSDDPNFFYRVKEVSIGAVSRAGIYKGLFTVTFRCDPYKYCVAGQVVLRSAKEYAFNPYDECHPRYILMGSGAQTLTVNGHVCRVDVLDQVTIDTDRKRAYLKDGRTAMPLIEGDFDWLHLKPGQNEISCSCSLAVVTNWRCV
ncbi:hypothetical protein [uncultured Dubosiella sp.]|uniref:hypothetical protein n=1 Tax=uncultured Dubosiella sp. TaxID=1937011 RepID=UPI0025B513C2|nr:hypothetical protein [uncultured Dubosiella sp.]